MKNLQIFLKILVEAMNVCFLYNSPFQAVTSRVFYQKYRTIYRTKKYNIMVYDKLFIFEKTDVPVKK